MTRYRAVPPGLTTITTMRIDDLDGSADGILRDDHEKSDVNYNDHAIDDLTAISTALRGCSGLGDGSTREASRHRILELGGTNIGADHGLCVMCCRTWDSYRYKVRHPCQVELSG